MVHSLIFKVLALFKVGIIVILLCFINTKCLTTLLYPNETVAVAVEAAIIAEEEPPTTGEAENAETDTRRVTITTLKSMLLSSVAGLEKRT